MSLKYLERSWKVSLRRKKTTPNEVRFEKKMKKKLRGIEIVVGGEDSEKPIRCAGSSFRKEPVHRALKKLKDAGLEGKMEEVGEVFRSQSRKLEHGGCIKG